MAWTGLGFDGSISESQEAVRAPHMGVGTPVVVAPGDLKITVKPAFDRTVDVAPGMAWGFGVLAVSDTTISIQLPTLGSGTRWDAIVLRRDWTDNSLNVIAIPNPTLNAKVVPTGQLANNPGVVHDQLLALVQVTAGQTSPTALIDLRCWASKTITTADLLAVPFPFLGMEALVAGKRYYRALDANGNQVWRRPLPIALNGTSAMTTLAGWAINSPLMQRCLIDETGTDIEYVLEIRRTGSALRFLSDGNMIDVNALVGNLKGPLPDRGFTCRGHVQGGSSPTGNASYGCDVSVATNGLIAIICGEPNAYIRKSPGSTVFDFRVSIRFRKAVAS